jgi:hypothetical protein
LNLFATEYVRRICGGSAKAFVVRCSDDNYYVVKLQNNPQGKRILANDLFGALLAKRLGLPVAEPSVIDISVAFLNRNSEMIFIFNDKTVSCQPGLSFGSRYVSNNPFGARMGAEPVDTFLARNRMMKVTNLADFIGMLVFDRWTSNRDIRQIAYRYNRGDASWTAIMIDQGACFGGAGWDFPDVLGLGLCNSDVAYESIAGPDVFEPWLDRIENEIDETVLEQLASQVPTEWYDGDATALSELVATLSRRRGMVRKLLLTTWEDYPRIFPSWIAQSTRPMLTVVYG